MKKATNRKPLSKSTLKKLTEIAMAADYGLERRGNLDDRMNDEEDFPEISIRAIRTMLEEAYRLGQQNPEKD